MSVAEVMLVVEPGWATTIQDAGRRGVAAYGVPRAGAVDPASHELANRLVGNDPRAAAIETAGHLVIEAVAPLVAATSGDGRRHTLAVGERLRVDAPADGQWSYLALRGGLRHVTVLGSMSHDTLSGLGPPPLVAGSVLAVGADPRTPMPVDLAPRPRRTERLRLWPGPRDPESRGLLLERTWVVKEEVSRVGARLAPSAAAAESVPAPAAAGPSEGLIAGAVQLTPAGEPIVMLANHPTTGGYPVIAVVDPDDLGAVAQARPGTRLRFRRAEGR